jgi:hypothetical protein
MNSIVGFSLFYKISTQRTEAAIAAQDSVLGPLTHLRHLSISMGETRLEVWGHNDLKNCIHSLPDGSLLVLIGSPIGKDTLADVGGKIINAPASREFEIPWDGRVILLRISADGNRWTMWNDWLGSIPVFHADVDGGRVASTLEPVTVSAGGYTPDDFFLPGLTALMINGHPLADWTLYNGMKTVPQDCVVEWDEKGFRVKQVWSVRPSQSRWEAGWDDLVDEMYEVSRQAIVEALKTQSHWVLPLSSGLDSRLIAAVAAKEGANVRTYAYGAPNSTDVVYSKQIAQALGFPWTYVELQKDFLKRYTGQWANWFGSGMIFHGMYFMCFLDGIARNGSAPIVSGFLGDVLNGDALVEAVAVHANRSYQIEDDWYSSWAAKDFKPAAKYNIEDALERNADNIKEQMDAFFGARFQKLIFLELWNRQRLFTSYQSKLLDYAMGVATPFLNRALARFCLSLPRVALDHRRLMGDVFRRYYGNLAVIPGTYAQAPYKLTGRHLIKRRVAASLPPALHIGPLKGMTDVPLRMDIESVQATGKAALWPLFEVWEKLSAWLDVEQLARDFETIMKSKEDNRPLRRLQAAQTLAYRLLVK